MILKVFIFFYIFFVSILSANIIDIGSINEPTNILKQTQIYIDENNKHDFKYISKNTEDLFKTNPKEFLHIGYSADAIWLKFSIKNSSNSEVTKVLEISNQMLDDIFLYTSLNDTNYSEEKLGVMHDKIFNENILKFYFDISLKPGEIKEYYLKASSLSCSVYFDLNLMNKDELYKKEMNHQLILVLFFGALIALVIYNLFVYFFTKDLAYLYYTLYIFLIGWNHVSYSGIGLYVLPISLLEIDVYLAITYLSLISIFSLLFTRKFLNLKRYKKLDFIIKLFLLINIIFIIFTTPEFYPINLVVYFMLLSLIYMIFVSSYLTFKGDKNARLIIVGWSLILFGWIMLSTYNLGYWSLITHYPYLYEFTVFVEAILFSIALANKLNTTTKLEKSVKTNEVLTRELHHRVKNNMQFIISMYRLKLAKFSNRNLSGSLKEVEGTIQAMSATHEMLYTQKSVENIDANEYFTTLIDKLKNSYDTSKISINLEITTDLNIDNSIYVGIILNELITNSFKYAFENSSGEINISLKKENKNYELIVVDDGIGFDSKQVYDTFGIELVKTLVDDELHGKLKLSTSRGSKYIINWN